MPRVKRGVTARASHKKVLARAKGFRGRRNNVFRIANEAARFPQPVDCAYQCGRS
jgi:large subunit ribosomal protein L20